MPCRILLRLSLGTLFCQYGNARLILLLKKSVFLLVKLGESLLSRLSVLPLSSELPHLTQHGGGEGVDELQQLYFASRHGVFINDYGGYYQRGKTYGWR